jgi:hypothetical protein
MSEHRNKLGKRWFGALTSWLKNVTTVSSSNSGDLPLNYETSLLLWSKSTGCPNAKAEMSVYLDTSLYMQANYAYYFEGTIVPPQVTDTYAYLGMQPEAYLGITVNGMATATYQTGRKALIPALTYPGLAIKGLAVVGPQFDIYGQMTGKVTRSGQMGVGARYTFEKSEMYWPQGSESDAYDELQGGDGNPEPRQTGLSPEFEANVQANAQLDFQVTPEASIGIQVGGSNFISSTSLVSASISAFVNNTLRFG